MNPKPMSPLRLLEAGQAWSAAEKRFEQLKLEQGETAAYAAYHEQLGAWAATYGPDVLAAAMDGELCGEILGAHDPASAPIAPMFFPDRVRTLTAQAKEKEPGRHAPDFR